MKKENHIILGVHITDRLKHASVIQQTLSEYGCNIKTRLGLHETGSSFCSPNGVLILELVGDQKQCTELEKRLAEVEGVEVQKMVFEHN